MWANKNWGAGGSLGSITTDLYQPFVEVTNDVLINITELKAPNMYPDGVDDLNFWWANDWGGVLGTNEIETLLPGPVIIDETEYNIESPLGIKWSNETQRKFIRLSIENDLSGTIDYPKVTMAGFWKTEIDELVFNFHNIFAIQGDNGLDWAVLQAFDDSGQLKITVHTADAGQPTIDVSANTLYWLNCTFDGPGDKAYVGVFDPVTFQHVPGSPIEIDLLLSDEARFFDMGRSDAHGNNANLAGTFSYLSQFMMSLTGEFPLIPSGGGSTSKGWGN